MDKTLENQIKKVLNKDKIYTIKFFYTEYLSGKKHDIQWEEVDFDHIDNKIKIKLTDSGGIPCDRTITYTVGNKKRGKECKNKN
jgi:hypothetical protein